HKARGGSSFADGEGSLLHAFKRSRKCLHVRDFTRHQELERVLRTGVVAKIDQPLIDDLRTGLSRNIAAQVHVKLARDLEIVGRPRVALRVEQIDAAAARYGDERISLCLLTI